MNISDGFSIWIGKVLAELLVFVVVVGAIAVAFLSLFAWVEFKDWRRRRKAAREIQQ